MGEVVAILGIVAVFGIPLSAIWTHHQRELAKIKAQQGPKGSSDVTAQLNAIRQEMALLRDTTTKFDMSFDAALSRLEQRMDKAEENIAEIRPATRPVIAPTEPESAVLSARNG
jgi:hypothetical protein